MKIRNCYLKIASNQSEKQKFMSFRLFPFRSPLLRKSHMLSFPPGTKMFQFPGFPRICLYIQQMVIPHYRNWVPPFGDPRITACLAAPRGLSQPTTSFFGVCTFRHPLYALSRLLQSPTTARTTVSGLNLHQLN